MSDFLNNGICPKTRRIFLYGDVEEEAVGKAIRGIYAMLATDKNAPITIFVSSYGGSLDDAMALVDVVRLASCPIRTVALGKCMSAAPLIVAAGTGGRYAMPNTMWMLHDVSQNVGEGSPAFLSSMAKAGKSIVARYASLLGQWTDREESFWKGIFRSKSDRFFTSDDALDWGIVDEVFEEEEEEE